MAVDIPIHPSVRPFIRPARPMEGKLEAVNSGAAVNERTNERTERRKNSLSRERRTVEAVAKKGPKLRSESIEELGPSPGFSSLQRAPAVPEPCAGAPGMLRCLPAGRLPRPKPCLTVLLGNVGQEGAGRRGTPLIYDPLTSHPFPMLAPNPSFPHRPPE